MQLMVLILVLFTLISIAGFIGAFFFGAAGAVGTDGAGFIHLLYRNSFFYRPLRCLNIHSTARNF